MANHFNAWQYSRWVYVTGRTLRTNTGSAGEITAAKNFLTSILAGRPWLSQNLQGKREPNKGIATANAYDISKMVQVAGRDLKKIPLTDAEKVLCETLFAATGNRKLGFTSSAT